MFFKKNPIDEPPLNITIVGCGKVGQALIEALSKEGNNITLIDKDASKLTTVSEKYDIIAHCGNGASYTTLIDSGIGEADVIIAVTESDELNLLCCLVASQVGSCSTIARVRTPDYNQEIWYLKDKLGLSMVINPELETAAEIRQFLSIPAATEVYKYARGGASMIRFPLKAGSILEGARISDFMMDNNLSMVFTAVEREGKVSIPMGDFVFKEGDSVSFVSDRTNVYKSMKVLGITNPPLKSYMMIGGGRIAYYLGSILARNGIQVKIIEKNPKTCQDLAEKLPHAVIINADGTDTKVLEEEGVAYTDAFIALTDIDEVNIMLTFYAKSVSNAKLVTKISHSDFAHITDTLELGSIVYPKQITTDMILRYVRAKRVATEDSIETLYHMFDGEVEAIEFNVEDDPKIIGKSLIELQLKDHVIIAFIQRKGKIIIPKGSDTIEKGDSVMIVTTHLGFNDINDILA